MSPLVPRGPGVSSSFGEGLLGVRRRAKHISPSQHPRELDALGILFIACVCT